jgi:hypothetical protein
VPTCPADPSQLGAEYAKSMCAKNNQCCTIDLTGCLTGEVDDFNSAYPDLAAMVQQNAVSIDCGKFTDCMNGVLSASCSAWPGRSGYFGADPAGVAACHQFVVPLLQPGQACTQDYACVDGFCYDTEGGAGDGGLGDNKCHAFVASGGTCVVSPSQVGDEDRACNPATDFCGSSNTCEARKANGGSCAQSRECTSNSCVGPDGGVTCVPPSSCTYEPSAFYLPSAGCSMSPTRAGGKGAFAQLVGVVGGVLFCVRRRRRKNSAAPSMIDHLATVAFLGAQKRVVSTQGLNLHDTDRLFLGLGGAENQLGMGVLIFQSFGGEGRSVDSC